MAENPKRPLPERKEYLRDLKRKKILTLEVNRQLFAELGKRRRGR